MHKMGKLLQTEVHRERVVRKDVLICELSDLSYYVYLILYVNHTSWRNTITVKR